MAIEQQNPAYRHKNPALTLSQKYRNKNKHKNFYLSSSIRTLSQKYRNKNK